MLLALACEIMSSMSTTQRYLRNEIANTPLPKLTSAGRCSFCSPCLLRTWKTWKQHRAQLPTPCLSQQQCSSLPAPRHADIDSIMTFDSVRAVTTCAVWCCTVRSCSTHTATVRRVRAICWSWLVAIWTLTTVHTVNARNISSSEDSYSFC